MSLPCSKCGHNNPETFQFCVRCHTPLRYTCPSCKHVQEHGGQCDQCGLDFMKYGMTLMFQAQAQARQERERTLKRSGIIKQIILAPLTGGLSLLWFFRSRMRRD
ncbi:MAG: zinc ribbon domain-containing protein [Acidobacteria bacterium]|nr:zinc ribbon domain-containing protein [Acidobacteriota bacterium]